VQIGNDVSIKSIAILGIGCRFPGANDPEAFWQCLRQGADAVTTAPANRWNDQAFNQPDLRILGEVNSRWSGFLEAVDQFDFYFQDLGRAQI
jgi:acyl transferase domain-containing protein